MSVDIDRTILKKRKLSKKIHKVALCKLLTKMLFLFRSDNYFRPTEGLLVSRLSGRVLQAREHVSQKSVFKIQIHYNANNKS